MLCRMQPTKYALPLMVLSLCATSVAHARGTIDKVDIKGLDKGDDAEGGVAEVVNGEVVAEKNRPAGMGEDPCFLRLERRAVCNIGGRGGERAGARRGDGRGGQP